MSQKSKKQCSECQKYFVPEPVKDDGSDKCSACSPTQQCDKCKTMAKLCPSCQLKEILSIAKEASIVDDDEAIEVTAKLPSGKRVSVDLFLESQVAIGRGAFGAVYKIKSKIDGGQSEYVALKDNVFHDEQAEAELKLLGQLKHPAVLAVRYQIDEPGFKPLATELMSDGDLWRFSRSRFSPENGIGIYADVFGFQMFHGLGYLHYNEIVHRDIKPENLLVSGITGMLKIGDFGCAKKLLPSRPYDSCGVGTTEFRAPELLLRARFCTTAVDVWSAVVVMSELLGGKPIFDEGPKSEHEQLLRISKYLGMVPKRRTNIEALIYLLRHQVDVGTGDMESYCRSLPGLRGRDHRPFLDLLQQNLTYEPSDRMSAYDICAHEYFADLFKSGMELPNGNNLPSTLFIFSSEELSKMSDTTAQILAEYRKLLS